MSKVIHEGTWLSNSPPSVNLVSYSACTQKQNLSSKALVLINKSASILSLTLTVVGLKCRPEHGSRLVNNTATFRCDADSLTRNAIIHTNRRGVSIVELLTVVAIIIILLSLLFPAIQAVREAARRTSCLNNLRQNGLAISSWSASHSDKLPPSWRTIQDASGEFHSLPELSFSPSSFSWRATLLPQIDQEDLQHALDFDLAPMNAANWQAISKVIPVFQCPSTPNSPRSYQAVDGADGSTLGTLLGATDYEHVQFASTEETPLGQISHITALPGAWYGLNNWKGGRPTRAFELQGSRGSSKLSWIRDGVSNTILVVEKAGQQLNYPRTGPTARDLGGAWAVSELGGIAKHAINEHNWSGIFSFHPNGANIVMCDGSTRFVDEDASTEIIVALSSRAGGETSPDDR